MPKVLVLGAGGMAGHVVSLYLREQGFEVDTLAAKNKLDETTMLVDATNKKELEAILSSVQYDAVINCIGILVKQSEERKDLAAYLNSYLPHQLEYFYRNAKTKVIHLSTDCVFSGKNAPYRENSPYDGESFYDRSKALGELKNDKDLTLRMSIIGPDMQPTGIGLFNWFYAQTGEILGFTNTIWSGITTVELAKGVRAAIEQNLTGLYHLVPNENISKYELVKLFTKAFVRPDITVKPDSRLSLDKTLINTRTDFNHSIPNYATMLHEMKDWIDSHRNLYEHYK
jgi:dTDP-4-dehydrorhamnose reductase